jgi:hypothetical protein
MRSKWLDLAGLVEFIEMFKVSKEAMQGGPCFLP